MQSPSEICHSSRFANCQRTISEAFDSKGKGRDKAKPKESYKERWSLGRKTFALSVFHCAIYDRPRLLKSRKFQDSNQLQTIIARIRR